MLVSVPLISNVPLKRQLPRFTMTVKSIDSLKDAMSSIFGDIPTQKREQTQTTQGLTRRQIQDCEQFMEAIGM